MRFMQIVSILIHSIVVVGSLYSWHFLCGLALGFALSRAGSFLPSWRSILTGDDSNSTKEPLYSVDNLVLNLPLSPPSWMNLGLWDCNNSAEEGSTKFERACLRMADQLASAAEFSKEDIIFDAGFGCGDQDLHWKQQFNVKDIVGYNLSRSQTELARKKLKCSGISFNCGDALAGLAASGNEPFTKIVCLDSAYHFTTRAAFFKEAHRALAENGRLVAIDLALQQPLDKLPLIQRAKTRLMAFVVGIPQANLCTIAQYHQLLERLQFSQVSVEPLTVESPSSSVFLPLADHITTILDQYGPILSAATVLKFRGAARMMRYIGNNNIFHVVLAIGTKSEPNTPPLR